MFVTGQCWCSTVTTENAEFRFLHFFVRDADLNKHKTSIVLMRFIIEKADSCLLPVAPGEKPAAAHLAGELEAQGGADPQTERLYQFNRKDKSDLAFCFNIIDMNVLFIIKIFLPRPDVCNVGTGKNEMNLEALTHSIHFPKESYDNSKVQLLPTERMLRLCSNPHTSSVEKKPPLFTD